MNSDIFDKRRERAFDSELKSFVAELAPSEKLTPFLIRLMDEKGLTAPQVYHRAELDRKVFNKLVQIKNPQRARKQTLLQVCIGICASEREAEELLRTCGYTFELGLNSDRAFLFCIRKGLYDMSLVYEAEYALGEQDSAGK